MGVKPSKVLMTYYTLIIPVSCLILAILLYTFDGGPPVPPWNRRFNSIDCHVVTFENLESEKGWFTFTLRSHESIEYPSEYLPNFLAVEIISQGSKLEYFSDAFKNLTARDNLIRFSVQHRWAGDSTINLKCLGHVLSTTRGYLNDTIDDQLNFSRADPPLSSVGNFHKVCIEYDKILYFSEIAGNTAGLPSGDHKLRFEMLKWDVNSYMLHKNVSLTPGTSVLAQPLSNEGWKNMILTVIPLISSTTSLSHRLLPNSKLVFKNENNSECDGIARFAKLGGSAVFDDISCFEHLIIPDTHSELTPATIEKVLDIGVTSMNQISGVKELWARKIAIAENLWDELHPTIQKNWRRTQIMKIRRQDSFTDAMNAARNAQILIGNHISSLIYMPFLAPGATVFDMTPKKYSCNGWARRMAESLNLSYAPLYEEKSCKCPDFKCYDLEAEESPTASEYREILARVDGLR